jgi:hypothetical protein
MATASEAPKHLTTPALLADQLHRDPRLAEAKRLILAAVADYTEVRDVTRVEVREARDVSLTLMFDPDRGLSERIIAEQFTV